jgi:hypothetical protein
MLGRIEVINCKYLEKVRAKCLNLGEGKKESTKPQTRTWLEIRKFEVPNKEYERTQPDNTLSSFLPFPITFYTLSYI